MELKYPLFPWDIKKTLRGKIVNPNSKQNPSIKVETWDQVFINVIVSTSSITTVASLEWPFTCIKGLGLWYMSSEFDLPGWTSILDSLLFSCTYLGAGCRSLWPHSGFCLKECLDTSRTGVPIPHIKNILPYYDHVFHSDFDYSHFPLYCSHFHFHYFCYKTV